MKTFTLFVNNEIVENKSVQNICESILELNLRKGDVFKLLPFNYDNDEKTNYKEEFLEWHGTMEIRSIEPRMIITWNNEVKTNISIHLRKI